MRPETQCGGGTWDNFDLRGYDLNHSILSHKSMEGANLSMTNLSGSDFTWTRLAGANLNGANLTEAILHSTDLSSAILNRTNLSRATITGSLLINTSLINANLTGADLTGSDLRGANLAGANLTNARLHGVTIDNSTQFPSGFDPVDYPHFQMRQFDNFLPDNLLHPDSPAQTDSHSPSEPDTNPPQPQCDSSYSGVCIPIVGYDLDCEHIGSSFYSIGSDPHNFDADGDGYACEGW